MRKTMSWRTICCACAGAAMLVLSLPGIVPGQDRDDRRQLLEQEQTLRVRIEALRKEQDFLLRQKALAAADSKYLILDLRAGKGTLRYRNRILRSFEFPARRRPFPTGSAAGFLKLDGKVDGQPRKRQLVFGDPLLIIHAKQAVIRTARGKPVVRIPVGTRDLAALFFALEKGSMALLAD